MYYKKKNVNLHKPSSYSIYFGKCIGYAKKILPFLFMKYQEMHFFFPHNGKM